MFLVDFFFFPCRCRFLLIQGPFTTFIILFFACMGWAHLPTDSNTPYNVEAALVGDPNGDTQALLDAWNEACAMPGYSNVTIPEMKTVFLNPVSFNGPCNSSNINFQVLGDIQAPTNISLWNEMGQKEWIKFHNISGLTINGLGQLNGQGYAWYACKRSQQCDSAPKALVIDSCTNVVVKGLQIVNSPRAHIGIEDSSWVYISHLSIMAPADSPNTDGIHLQRSQHVKITRSFIGTGDDCISIGSGAYDINISHIHCGPGHGISIGSLGGHESMATVEKIKVSSCSFFKTTNGARIKTWQGGSGFAKNITFKELYFTDVDRAIVIDQYYCNGLHNCQNKTSAVQVSDVRFVNVLGTSTNDVPIRLDCSETVACTDIILSNVQITSSTKNRLTSSCTNVKGTATRPIRPVVPCLTEK